jgi:hypothetical protein
MVVARSLQAALGRIATFGDPILAVMTAVSNIDKYPGPMGFLIDCWTA